LLAKYKNIIILKMSFSPDQVVGTIARIEFKANIQTDSKGQYIIVNNNKYYLSQFKVI